MSHNQPRDAHGHFLPAGKPPKKKGGCLKLVAGGLAALVLFFILIAACTTGGTDTDTGSETPESQPSTETQPEQTTPPAAETEPAEDGQTVRMVATSTSPGESSVNWMELGGSSNSKSFVAEWEHELQVTDPSKMYSFTVSPDWMVQGEQTVTCELYVDGELVDENTATGEPGGTMASCSQPLF